MAVPPEPESVSAVGEFAALLVNVRVPEAAPLARAVKTALKVLFCPAESVTGNEIPVMANSELVELAPVMFMEVPLAASDMLRLLLEPTGTLPKLRLEGLAVSCPAVLPDPERVTVNVGLEASDSTVTLPLLARAEEGAKVTLKV